MFERFTEKARRVVFFARYEARQFGSPHFEPEHLLLGLLREDTLLAARLSRSNLSVESLRKRIEEEAPPREEISLSSGLPLSSAAKAALAHAAEEAEGLRHQRIGTEHLLLGILRQGSSLAARLLVEAGFDVVAIRDDLRRTDHYPGQQVKPSRNNLEDCVEIHGELWSSDSVREFSEHYRKFHWEKYQWTPRDALAQRSNQKLHLYTGQTYDPEQVELLKGGWSEDHCAICWWRLSASGSPEHGEGYTNGQDWLCKECFEKFVSPELPPF